MSGKSEEVKETPQQRAMVDLALNKLQDYKRRWLPLQKNLADIITRNGADDSAARRAAKGVANVETEAKFAGARGGLETKLGQTGQLGSSKGKLAIAGLGEDQATSTGLGLTQAEQQIDDAYTQGLGTIMALGQGQAADAVQGMSRSAAMSGRRAAADAQASLEHRMGNAQLVGQLAGAGFGLMGPGGSPGMGMDPSGMATNSTGTSARAASVAAGLTP